MYLKQIIEIRQVQNYNYQINIVLVKKNKFQLFYYNKNNM